jgi:hypothetical protein
VCSSDLVERVVFGAGRDRQPGCPHGLDVVRQHLRRVADRDELGRVDVPRLDCSDQRIDRLLERADRPAAIRQRGIARDSAQFEYEAAGRWSRTALAACLT